MTYQGYMALANDEGEILELVNAARVKAYTDNLAPTLGLRGCEDCEGLPDALGETYSTPTADNAPWYDPTDPATADFYGVYPLAFEGIDDSTRSIQSAELTGDGSVVVGSRFTGKDIRVNGVAFAADEAALNAGISWLNSALNGTEEGRCFGDRLNLYSSCPPVQVLPPGFAEPYTLEVPVTQAEIDEWTTTSGTITNWTGSGDPGLRFDWATGDPEKIACREITGLIPGEQYQLRMRVTNFGDYYVRLADSCISSRKNLAPNPRMLGYAFTGAGLTDIESDESTGGPLGLGYHRSITTNTNTGSPYAVLTPEQYQIPVSTNTIYQLSVYVIGDNSTARLDVEFYDSSGVSVGPAVTLEGGVSMNSTWKRLSGIVEIPVDATAFIRPAIRFSSAVGGIQPNTVFGVANLLVEAPHYEEIRTNIKTDPLAVSDAMQWGFALGTGGVVTPAFIAGAVDGPVIYGSTTSPTYRRWTVTTEPTGGTAGPRPARPSLPDFLDPIPAGTPWVTGAWFRSNRTVSGTVFYRLLGAGSVTLIEASEPFTLIANTWTYYAGGTTLAASLAGVEDARVLLAVGGTGGGAAIDVGDIYEATGGLVQIGSATEDYYDGSRPVSGNFAYLREELPSGSFGATEVEAEPVGAYFDGYTDGFEWLGEPDNSISGTDQGIDYETVAGWGQEPPTEPTVLDFIPRADSIFLSITPTQTSPATPTEVLLIEELLVRRVPRPGVVAFGSGNNVVLPSDGWTHNAPATGEVTWLTGESVEFDTVRTDMRAPFGSALTYTTAHGIERTVFGLVPGSRYRLMIEFLEGWAETDADPIISLDPEVSIGNASGLVTTYTVDLGQSHFWVVEFTATATSSLIGLHPDSDLALGSFGVVTWSIDQYMVEEILETDATEPQPGRFQERTMYEVKASQGPIITNLRRAPCGVMAQITYSLRAGNPFKYRSPIFAGGLPAGTSQEVADVPCSDDGLPQIINFAYNPSVETNDLDWAVGGVNATAARTASPTAKVGDFVWRGTAPDTPGNRLDQLTAYYEVADVTSGPIPLPGDELTVSMYFRATAGAWIGLYTWDIFVTMDGFPPFSFSGSQDITDSGTWYRLEQTFTLPDNIDLQVIEVRVETPAAITQGGGMDIDGLMIQRGNDATEAFDETFPDVEWSGDANTSALLRNQELTDISADPDCPAPPTPPAPPEIDNDCISVPTTYNRTVVSISADTVPRNLTAYPVITLTAGSADVRQARIRFWENPDGLTVDELDPCAFEGEIIVSYLAAGATMVIDGVLREATVSLPGFPDQNANHVLYGPDGGPVDWPELSGGIPYLVTLELDSGEAYADTLMLVDLVVRD